MILQVNFSVLCKCCGLRNLHGNVEAQRKASRSIPVRGSVRCVLKGDLELARWTAVREWAVVRAGVAQFQEHCCDYARGSTTQGDTVCTGCSRTRHRERTSVVYQKYKQCGGLERPHGHSVVGDKAGTRKWRSFHGKLPPEGALGHHSDVELFVQGYVTVYSSDRFTFQVSGVTELECKLETRSGLTSV